MISPIAKQISSSGCMLSTRAMGAMSGCIKAVRKAFYIAFRYRVDSCNGDAVSVVDATFPLDSYTPLRTTPTWLGHRFLGWYTASTTPNVDGITTGTRLTAKDIALYEVPTVYAQWQLPSTVTFDATTNGGQMPSGWSMPYYFAGQPYGVLPIPTHPSLYFGGWYLNGTKVTAESIVPSGGAALVAQYISASYSVDLNNGAWVLDSSLNPDPSAYDGVFVSTNVGQDDTMVKMYIDVVGFTSFQVLIASNSESNYDYVVAMEPDEDPTDIPWFYPDDWGEEVFPGVHTGVIENTHIDPTDASQYTVVNYTLDGEQHRLCILYRKDSGVSDGADVGYILIPREQGE